MKGLIIGLGSIARKHIDAIRSIDPGIELYALRSGRGGSDVDGVENIYEPFSDWDSFDFVIVSNPTSLHATTLKRLAFSSVPLFIEKPVVGSINDSQLISELDKSGRLTYVACNLRFLECLGYIKNYINGRPEARINEVNVYCGSYLPDWRPGVDYRKTYSAIPELGGGVNIDLIHEIDYVCWLFGLPEKSRGLTTVRWASEALPFSRITSSPVSVSASPISRQNATIFSLSKVLPSGSMKAFLSPVAI